MRRISSKLVSVTLSVFIAALLLNGVGPLPVRNATAAEVTARSLKLSNSQPGQTSTYEVSFTLTTADTLGSILVEFCDNTALFEVSCNAPAGLDVTGAVLSNQSGETGFAIDPSSTANRLILSRAPSATPGSVSASYTLDAIQNASAAGSQYARFSTYATNDASGPHTDRGSVAYSLNPAFTVSTEVPPFLILCIGVTISGTDCLSAQGNYVNMGDFTSDSASTGQTQAVIATNAANGYTLSIGGLTMTSGTNGLPALSSPTTSSPGTSQFGINLRANSNPSAGQDPSGPGAGAPTSDYNQPNRFTYRSGDVISSHPSVSDFRKFTITYLVNISNAQPAGIYSSTFTYTGLGNF